LIPLCVFRSMDPEHAQRWSFYSNLYRFVSLPQTSIRLHIANLFFINCKKEIWKLKNQLNSETVNRDEFYCLRSRSDKILAEKRVLVQWLSRVGKVDVSNATQTSISIVEDYVQLERLSQSLMAIDNSNNNARSEIRRVVLNEHVDSTFSRTRKEFSLRSAIFRTWIDSVEGVIVSWDDLLLFYLGFFFMIIGILCTIAWAFSFTGFVVYGILYPIIEIIQRSFSPMDGALLLPFYLTIVYISLLLVLVMLLPSVYRFQSTRHDIVDVKGFPGVFYDVCVVREIHKRFVAEIDKREIERVLDYRFGRDIMMLIKSYNNEDSI
jgi:hypothetical protein